MLGRRGVECIVLIATRTGHRSEGQTSAEHVGQHNRVRGLGLGYFGDQLVGDGPAFGHCSAHGRRHLDFPVGNLRLGPRGAGSTTAIAGRRLPTSTGAGHRVGERQRRIRLHTYPIAHGIGADGRADRQREHQWRDTGCWRGESASIAGDVNEFQAGAQHITELYRRFSCLDRHLDRQAVGDLFADGDLGAGNRVAHRLAIGDHRFVQRGGDRAVDAIRAAARGVGAVFRDLVFYRTRGKAGDPRGIGDRVCPDSQTGWQCAGQRCLARDRCTADTRAGSSSALKFKAGAKHVGKNYLLPQSNIADGGRHRVRDDVAHHHSRLANRQCGSLFVGDRWLHYRHEGVRAVARLRAAHARRRWRRRVNRIMATADTGVVGAPGRSRRSANHHRNHQAGAGTWLKDATGGAADLTAGQRRRTAPVTAGIGAAPSPDRLDVGRHGIQHGDGVGSGGRGGAACSHITDIGDGQRIVRRLAPGPLATGGIVGFGDAQLGRNDLDQVIFHFTGLGHAGSRSHIGCIYRVAQTYKGIARRQCGRNRPHQGRLAGGTHSSGTLIRVESAVTVEVDPTSNVTSAIA